MDVDERARRCLDLVNWVPPRTPSPNALARALGITVIGKPTGSTEWDGSSGRLGQAWWICLNRQKPWRRRQWTLAHEIGHIMLHAQGGGGQWHRAGPADKPLEREADRFATLFLMPAPLMAYLAGRYAGDVLRISDHLGLTSLAVSYRLRELHLASSTSGGGRVGVADIRD